LGFAAYIALGAFLLALPRVNARFSVPWTRANVGAAAELARTVGLPASALGPSLTSGGIGLIVKRGCDGIDAALILSAAILAFPTSWPRRMLGLIGGASLIFAFNVLRLLTLLAFAAWSPSRLEFVHLYVWQTLMAILALATFVLWGRLVATRG
jgi:exosortase H (IPTLxxWG-CTERM-specific)